MRLYLSSFQFVCSLFGMHCVFLWLFLPSFLPFSLLSLFLIPPHPTFSPLVSSEARIPAKWTTAWGFSPFLCTNLQFYMNLTRISFAGRGHRPPRNDRFQGFTLSDYDSIQKVSRTTSLFLLIKREGGGNFSKQPFKMWPENHPDYMYRWPMTPYPFLGVSYFLQIRDGHTHGPGFHCSWFNFGAWIF